jgi:hypothetical protein
MLLLAIDCALLVSLVVGVYALKRSRPPVVDNAQAAFQVLDRSIEKFVPGLASGFTWGEAVEWLKGSGVKVDWGRMETSLAEYEAFRYGGRAMPKEVENEVIRLAMVIRRKILGYRNQGKSPSSN